jgi:hypothetical protein
VTISGNLTLTVTATEITGMNQANETIAIANPIEVTVSSRSDR